MREPPTGNVPQHVRARPTLRAVFRGRATDELVLIDADGRAVLLKGDGLTQEEAVSMAHAAFRLLGGRSEPNESEAIPAPVTARLPGGRDR
jgi:hypothetical protein